MYLLIIIFIILVMICGTLYSELINRYIIKREARQVIINILKTIKVDFKKYKSESINESNLYWLKDKEVVVITNKLQVLCVGIFVKMHNGFIVLRDARYCIMRPPSGFIDMGKRFFVGQPDAIYYNPSHNSILPLTYKGV